MIIVNRKDGDLILFLLPGGGEIKILIQKDRQESVRLLVNLPRNVKLSQVISRDVSPDGDDADHKH